MNLKSSDLVAAIDVAKQSFVDKHDLSMTVFNASETPFVFHPRELADLISNICQALLFEYHDALRRELLKQNIDIGRMLPEALQNVQDIAKTTDDPLLKKRLQALLTQIPPQNQE